MEAVKIMLPFLALLLLLVGVAGVLRVTVPGIRDTIDVVQLPGSVGNEIIASEAGASSLYAWSLASWVSCLPSRLMEKNSDTSSNSLLKSWWLMRASASISLPPSSSSLSAPSASALSLSSLTVVPDVMETRNLHNESKDILACPASCFIPNAVCGVDGVTYWCGSVDAECAGVEVAYKGFCDFGSKGTGGKGALAVQSMLLVHMIWLMLAVFLVLLGIP